MPISEVELRVRKTMCASVLSGLMSNPNIVRAGITRMGIENPTRIQKEDFYCTEAIRITNRLLTHIATAYEVEQL